MLSQRALAMKPSPTLAMAAKARDLQAQGKDVVSLTVGEPDWPTPDCAKKGAVSAIEKNFTRYTAAQGVIELRTAIAKETERQLNIAYKPTEVAVGAGAKFVLFAGLQMLVDPGDEVIIPTPYWVSYPAMVELAGGKSHIVECLEPSRFKITPDQLKLAINPRTKALILCSPSNPTGIQYSLDELKALAKVLREHPKVWIISDDIYNRLVFDGTDVAAHILHVAPEFRDRVFVVNGASKAYAMTGWRVGWGLGPQNLIAAVGDYFSQSTSNVSSVSQMAALAALQDGEASVHQAVSLLKTRFEKFTGLLSGINELRVIRPDGAFYIWLNVEKCFGRTHRGSGKIIRNSKDLAEVLLENHLVATVPGVEFGAEGYLRLSFAAKDADLEKAAVRLRDFVGSL